MKIVQKMYCGVDDTVAGATYPQRTLKSQQFEYAPVLFCSVSTSRVPINQTFKFLPEL